MVFTDVAFFIGVTCKKFTLYIYHIHATFKQKRRKVYIKNIREKYKKREAIMQTIMSRKYFFPLFKYLFYVKLNEKQIQQ